jgi:hypothetical protein
MDELKVFSECESSLCETDLSTVAVLTKFHLVILDNNSIYPSSSPAELLAKM